MAEQQKPPEGGMVFVPLRAHKKSSAWKAFLSGSESRRGEVFDPLRAHKKSSAWKAFLFGSQSPQGGWYSTLCALTKSLPLGRLFWFTFRVPAGGMVFDPLRAHKISPRKIEGFLFDLAGHVSKVMLLVFFQIFFLQIIIIFNGEQFEVVELFGKIQVFDCLFKEII